MEINIKGKVSEEKNSGLKRDIAPHQGGLSSEIPLSMLILCFTWTTDI